MGDYAALRIIIDSDSNNASLTHQQVAVLLNAQTKTVLRSRQLTARTFMAILGAAEGSVVLDNLQALAASNSAVNWVMKDITQGGIDIASSETQAMLPMLVAGNVLTQTQADTLTNSAMQTVSVVGELGFSVLHDFEIAKARGL